VPLSACSPHSPPLASPPEPDPRCASSHLILLFSRTRRGGRAPFFARSSARGHGRAGLCCAGLANVMLPDAVHHADAEERVPVTTVVSRGGQGSRSFLVVVRPGGKGKGTVHLVNHRCWQGAA
jgi:hypothetical protein